MSLKDKDMDVTTIDLNITDDEEEAVLQPKKKRPGKKRKNISKEEVQKLVGE